MILWVKFSLYPGNVDQVFEIIRSQTVGAMFHEGKSQDRLKTGVFVTYHPVYHYPLRVKRFVTTASYPWSLRRTINTWDMAILDFIPEARGEPLKPGVEEVRIQWFTPTLHTLFDSIPNSNPNFDPNDFGFDPSAPAVAFEAWPMLYNGLFLNYHLEQHIEFVESREKEALFDYGDYKVYVAWDDEGNVTECRDLLPD
jgi:hypothetical protein